MAFGEWVKVPALEHGALGVTFVGVGGGSRGLSAAMDELVAAVA